MRCSRLPDFSLRPRILVLFGTIYRPSMNRNKPHPLILWASIGLLSAVGIFVVSALLPWKASDLEPHKRLVQAVLFTACAFVVWVSVYWHWRRLGAFWLSVFAFLLIHVVCVFLYSSFLQPILVWQWGILLAVESYLAFFFFEWLTRRLTKSRLPE